MILCLALTLCLVCGLALAEETPQEPVTRTIQITNDKGEVIKEIVVTKDVTINPDGTETVRWLDEFGYDWGDDDIIVLDGHDYSMDDTDYPENNDNVVVVFLPTDSRNGQFRVHCKNHPNDKEDVKEYTIYFEDHDVATKQEVLDAIAAGTFNKDEFEGFVSYKAPVCATGTAGKAKVKCTCDPVVHWDNDTGRYVAHDALCSFTKTYTIPAEHMWSDELEEPIGQPYHDLVKPTCYTEGKIVGYCVLCGIDKHEVLGEDAIITVEPLKHFTITGEDATELRVRKEANCVEWGEVAVWCTLCEDWVPDEEVWSDWYEYDQTNYPIKIEPNGKHVYSKWIFDAYAIEKVDGKYVELKETCTEEGLGYFHRICQKCHTVFGTEQRVIPATGHEWGDDEEFGWKPMAGHVATCVVPGQEERTCSWCKGEEDGGYETRESELDPMAHILVDGDGNPVYESGVPVSALIIVDEKPATCDEDDPMQGKGYVDYFCTECGQYVYQILPALTHDWGKVEHWEGWCGGNPEPDKNNICGNHTYDVMVCKRCDKVHIVEDYGVIEHNYNEWELRNKYELYEDGQWTPEYWVRYCKNVHKLEDGTIVKCAHHEDFVRDFAVKDAGKTPDDVLAEEAGEIVPPAPADPVYTVSSDDLAIETDEYGAIEIAGTATIENIPDGQKVYARITLYFGAGHDWAVFVTYDTLTGPDYDYSAAIENAAWASDLMGVKVELRDKKTGSDYTVLSETPATLIVSAD